VDLSHLALDAEKQMPEPTENGAIKIKNQVDAERANVEELMHLKTQQM